MVWVERDGDDVLFMVGTGSRQGAEPASHDWETFGEGHVDTATRMRFRIGR
ncbi:hypothetical protein GCM10009559_37220 [Pseudonocardia zijingensis]|uniref:Uncharacterized protein n=1 Tax=Pseudonocardia zijingensis TaxID=153376 RepID=A0ABN1QF26_9PSEU